MSAKEEKYEIDWLAVLIFFNLILGIFLVIGGDLKETIVGLALIGFSYLGWRE